MKKFTYEHDDDSDPQREEDVDPTSRPSDISTIGTYNKPPGRPSIF